MLIREVIDMAKTGELRNIAASSNDEAILSYINLGMIELYKRFPLETKEDLFDRVDGVNEHKLPADFMWLVSAYGTIIRNNRLELAQLAINEDENIYSINTVSWNTVQIGLGVAAGQVSLVYVASPPSYTVADADTVDIAIPAQFLEPLLHYVGYRAHGAINGNIDKENNTHYQRFEASCNKAKSLGMYTSDGLNMEARLNLRGFT